MMRFLRKKSKGVIIFTLMAFSLYLVASLVFAIIGMFVNPVPGQL